MDESDIVRCRDGAFPPQPLGKPPVIVKFNDKGQLTVTHLQPDSNAGRSCLETHVWCPDKKLCLPVFVICNGVYDCLGREDEQSCDVHTCPGFYRCRASKVCVHVTHVCDGHPQCPQRDDELLCRRPCPVLCTCHGLAFFCPQVFAANQFPQLRYLDMRDSGMNVHQLSDNHMLIHLSLARCGVTNMTNVTFRNMHSLDLSDNLLTEVSCHHFKLIPWLNVLFLAGNPLTSVFRILSDCSSKLSKIHALDLSRVKMQSADPSLFLVFPDLQTLNLSYSGIRVLQWNTSQTVESLRQLDLRGCVMAEFPGGVLRKFVNLQLLFANNFKMCCPSALPPGFDLNYRHVTPDDVSSCDNLLGSVTYRATVAVLATLGLLGNVVSLVMRVCVGNTSPLSGGNFVLTHLSVADLGTGLYLATLGLADRYLDGHYVWHDDTWRRGAVCHLAGILALCCRHAATLFIAILTLDRWSYSFLTSGPLPPARVKVMCVSVWISSVVLYILPLLSDWRFGGHHALCLPLPHKRIDSTDSQYIYGVMLLAPFTVFVLCSVCEIVRCFTGKAAEQSIMNNSPCPKHFQFVVIGSLSSGLLFTIACLVITDSHTYQQKTMHTALVYFGYVVSCAMNPYLHLYGVRVERGKRRKAERLLRIINRARV